jgi:hypothetical protein
MCAALLLQTYQNWIFVSLVKGGGPANAMVKSLETEWGRKLYGRTLISNIGQSVYKVRHGSMQQHAVPPHKYRLNASLSKHSEGLNSPACLLSC